MNFSSIILLLQMALGLLSNPMVTSNADLRAQALSFANQAVSMATAALVQESNTSVTSTSYISSPATTTVASMPIVMATSSTATSTATATNSTTSSVTTSEQSATSTLMPALLVGIDPSEAPSGKIATGAIGNQLAIFRFSESANAEGIKITDLKIIDVVSSTAAVNPSFTNVALLSVGSASFGGAPIGSPVADAAGNAYIYSFHFQSPVIIPIDTTIILILRGDVASDATPDSVHQFEIATTSDPNNNASSLAVSAIGQVSGKVAAVTLSKAIGNPQTIVAQ